MLWRSGLLILLLALLGGCKEETLAQGEIAPALAAFDMQGKEASLDRWRGKASISISGPPAAAAVWPRWTRWKRSASAGGKSDGGGGQYRSRLGPA
ncbi:hypothetical protein SODG_007366 [Sodalis praecaptivus]